MKRLSLMVVLAIAAALLAVPPVTAAVPTGYDHTDLWFEAHDGIQLHASVFLPADRAEDEVHPVMLVPTPYAAPNGGALGLGQLSSGPADVRFPELFGHPSFTEDRWAYVEYDTRSFGGSGGCFQYYLQAEAIDMQTAIEHIHGQDWAGEVALWGKSYDAAQHVLALAQDNAVKASGGEGIDGLAATVIQAPGLSAYTALWQNGIHYATGRYATTGVYNADDLFPSQNTTYLTDQNYLNATLAPITDAPNYPTCRSDMLVNANVIFDQQDPFWQDKEPYLGAEGADVPTFWIHGFHDANTKPGHIPIWTSLTGPTKAWFGQFDHIRGQEAGVSIADDFLDEAFSFLAVHMFDAEATEVDDLVTVQQGDSEAWRHEAAWPPADVIDWTMPLNTGSYADEPGGSASSGGADGNRVLSVTPELPHDIHTAGEIRVDATVDVIAPMAHMVALVYAVDGGRARFVQRGAQLIADAGANELSFTLYPQDWEFREGERIAVVLTAGDDNWYSPAATMQDVTITEATATFPVLPVDREDVWFGDGSTRGSGVAAWNVGAIAEGDEVAVDFPAAQTPPQG